MRQISMTFDVPLTGISEVSTAKLSSADNSTGSPADQGTSTTQDTFHDYPQAAAAGPGPQDASSSGRSLKLSSVFKREKSQGKRGSFISMSSIRSSMRSSFASSHLDDSDDDDDEEHIGDDLTPKPGSGRRRSSLFRGRSSRRGSAFSSRSSIGRHDSSSGHMSSGSLRGTKQPARAHRKSSLDLIKNAGGTYRPRAEHPLLVPQEERAEKEEKTKRRGSFLGLMARSMSSGHLKSKGGELASSSDHGPSRSPRKNSFFGSLRRSSHGTPDDSFSNLNMAHSVHGYPNRRSSS